MPSSSLPSPSQPQKFAGPWNKTLSNDILIIGNLADPITARKHAQLAHLLQPNSRLISHEGFGHCSTAMPSVRSFSLFRYRARALTFFSTPSWILLLLLAALHRACDPKLLRPLAAPLVGPDLSPRRRPLPRTSPALLRVLGRRRTVRCVQRRGARVAGRDGCGG